MGDPADGQAAADSAPDTASDPLLRRVLRAAAVPGLLPALTERLSPTDLQTLLLAVFRRRAAAVTPGRLLEQYERNRFVAPSALDQAALARLYARDHPGVAVEFDDERAGGRGYYTGACFGISATTREGDAFDVADGGFTTWTADLLSNAKERLLISGLGIERLCGLFARASPA